MGLFDFMTLNALLPIVNTICLPNDYFWEFPETESTLVTKYAFEIVTRGKER